MHPGDIPRIRQLLWPTLRATRELGGVAKIREINERAAQIAGLSIEQLAVLHGSEKTMTEVDYRLRWARTNLKTIGALANPSTGTWSVTDFGNSLTQESMLIDALTSQHPGGPAPG